MPVEVDVRIDPARRHRQPRQVVVHGPGGRIDRGDPLPLDDDTSVADHASGAIEQRADSDHRAPGRLRRSGQPARKNKDDDQPAFHAVSVPRSAAGNGGPAVS